MTMDKKCLEEKIAATANELFSLSKNEREHSEEFKTLKIKLAADIWKWSCIVFKKKVENAGVEIMECINRSFSSFSGETSYVNYISAALKKEIQRANEKEFVEKQRLISLPDKKRRKLNYILHYAELLGRDIKSEAVQRELAKEFGCSQKEIAELVLYNFRSFAQSDTITQDGGELSLFDCVPDQRHEGVENALGVRAELEEQFSVIDETFKGMQERTKPYLSALVTNCVLREAENASALDIALDLLSAFSFAKSESAQKIVERYKSGEEPFSQKEIAAWFNREESDASRTFKKFLEKVSTRLENDYNYR